MSRVITFSRTFPAYHPKKGQLTYFVEKLLASLNPEGKTLNPQPFEPPLELHVKWIPKHHTIRSGHRFKAGYLFSPRVWYGKPYFSKQITIAPDIEIKKVWNLKVENTIFWLHNGKRLWNPLTYDEICRVAGNDGLSVQDFLDWFQYPKPGEYQIICWNESINY